MTERWEEELARLDRLEPSPDVHARVGKESYPQSVPVGRETPARRAIVIVTSFAIFLTAGAFAWRALTPASQVPQAGSRSPGGGVPGGLLAFTRETQGRPQTWLIGADGTDLRPMEIRVYSQVDPAWSPDGSRLAFSGTNERNTEPTFIFVVNADGSDLEQLTDAGGGQADADPAWSPDGSRIVFSRLDAAGQSSLFVLNVADRSVEEVLTDDEIPFFQAVTPDYSPDGSQIAFTGNTDGKVGIFVMDADGRNVHPVTPLRGDEGADSPSWSPNGRLLAYSAHGDIYVQEADRSETTNLTNTRDLFEAGPEWSPDGDQIAFLGGPCSAPCRPTRTADVFLMDAQGSNIRRLTETADGGYSPTSIENPSWLFTAGSDS